MLYVATVCQVIRVIYLVYQQCNCDIFLIDWETPYDTYHIAESSIIYHIFILLLFIYSFLSFSFLSFFFYLFLYRG